MPSSLLCTCFFCIWHWLDWIYIPNITEQSNSVATEFALSISCASRVRKIGRPWNSSRPQDIGALWLRSVESRCSTNKKIGKNAEKWCSFSRICLFIQWSFRNVSMCFTGVSMKIQADQLIEASGATATRHPDISAWHKPWPALGLRRTKKKTFQGKKRSSPSPGGKSCYQKETKTPQNAVQNMHWVMFGCASSAWKWPWWVQIKVSKPCRWCCSNRLAWRCFFGIPHHLVAWPKPLYPDSNDWEKVYKQYIQPLSNHATFMSWCLKGKAKKKHFQTCRQSPCSSFGTPKKNMKTISFHQTVVIFLYEKTPQNK